MQKDKEIKIVTNTNVNDDDDKITKNNVSINEKENSVHAKTDKDGNTNSHDTKKEESCKVSYLCALCTNMNERRTKNIKIKKKVKFSDSKGFSITYFNTVN